jgi:hypothetical protein
LRRNTVGFNEDAFPSMRARRRWKRYVHLAAPQGPSLGVEGLLVVRTKKAVYAEDLP